MSLFDKVVVALDGSELSQRIIPALTPLLRPEGEVIFVHVLPAGPVAKDDAAQAVARDEVRRRAEELQRAGAPASGHVLIGDDPARAVTTFAAGAGATSIAAATHGRSGLRRLLLGSVAESIVRLADRPVLLVNPWSAAPRPLRRVLVPLDGSERGDAVLLVAATLRREHGAELVLFHAEELGVLDPTIAVAEEHRQTVMTMERARRLLGDSSARAVVKPGRAADELPEALREESPDLLVMATHGRTGLARVAFGSVTEAMLRRAPCPVLVIRSLPQGA